MTTITRNRWGIETVPEHVAWLPLFLLGVVIAWSVDWAVRRSRCA